MKAEGFQVRRQEHKKGYVLDYNNESLIPLINPDRVPDFGFLGSPTIYHRETRSAHKILLVPLFGYST